MPTISIENGMIVETWPGVPTVQPTKTPPPPVARRLCFKCQGPNSPNRGLTRQFHQNPLTHDGLSILCVDCTTPAQNQAAMQHAASSLARVGISPCVPITLTRVPITQKAAP